jgi:hypothetical protein
MDVVVGLVCFALVVVAVFGWIIYDGLKLQRASNPRTINEKQQAWARDRIEQRLQLIEDHYGHLSVQDLLATNIGSLEHQKALNFTTPPELPYDESEKAHLLMKFHNIPLEDGRMLVRRYKDEVAKRTKQEIRRRIDPIVAAALGDAPASESRERFAIAEAVRHAVWRRDQGRCTLCESNENLEFDHIIPHSRGGSNTERNLQLLCAPCNRAKAASV